MEDFFFPPSPTSSKLSTFLESKFWEVKMKNNLNNLY